MGNEIVPPLVHQYICPVPEKATFWDFIICLVNIGVERPKDVWIIWCFIVACMAVYGAYHFSKFKHTIKKIGMIVKTFAVATQKKRLPKKMRLRRKK